MKAASVALMALLAGGVAYAGPPADTGKRQSAMMERLATDLNLNEQQKSEVQRIMNEHWQQRQAERERAREELRQQLGSVLTPEQMQAWEARQQQMRDRMQNRQFRQGGSAPAPRQQ